MRIKGVGEAELNKIAKRLGLRMDNQRAVGKYWAFVLRMPNPGCTRFRKRGFSGKWTYAVCYHGHLEFMYQVFQRNPNAVIRTTMESYVGVAEFRHKAPNIANRNVGSSFKPQDFEDQCNCRREHLRLVGNE